MNNPQPVYHPPEAQWLRRLHRLAGVGLFLFLALHIGQIWLMALGPGPFNAVAAILRQPPARLLDIALLFGVLFHAINGVRVSLLDVAPGLVRFERLSIYLALFGVALVFIPGALLILMDAFLPAL